MSLERPSENEESERREECQYSYTIGRLVLQSGISNQLMTKLIQLGMIDRLAVGLIGFLQGRGTRQREENVGINSEIPMNGYDRQLASRSVGSRYQCQNSCNPITDNEIGIAGDDPEVGLGMRLKLGTMGMIARRKNPSMIERNQCTAFQIKEHSSGIGQPIRQGVNIDEKKKKLG